MFNTISSDINIFLSISAEDNIPTRQPVQKCPGIECRTSPRCISKKHQCDRIVDCLEGDDEMACPTDTSFPALIKNALDNMLLLLPHNVSEPEAGQHKITKKQTRDRRQTVEEHENSQTNSKNDDVNSNTTSLSLNQDTLNTVNGSDIQSNRTIMDSHKFTEEFPTEIPENISSNQLPHLNDMNTTFNPIDFEFPDDSQGTRITSTFNENITRDNGSFEDLITTSSANTESVSTAIRDDIHSENISEVTTVAFGATTPDMKENEINYSIEEPNANIDSKNNFESTSDAVTFINSTVNLLNNATTSSTKVTFSAVEDPNIFICKR